MAERRSTDGVHDEDREAIIRSRPPQLRKTFPDEQWIGMPQALRQPLIDGWADIAASCAQDVVDKRLEQQRAEWEKVDKAARESAAALQSMESQASEVDAEEKALFQKKKKIATDLEARRLRAAKDAETKARVLAEQGRTDPSAPWSPSPSPEPAAAAGVTAAPAAGVTAAPAAGITAAPPPVSRGEGGFTIPRKPLLQLAEGISSGRGAGASPGNRIEGAPSRSDMAFRFADHAFAAVPLKTMSRANCLEFAENFRGDIQGFASFLFAATAPAYRETASIQQYIEEIAAGRVVDNDAIANAAAVLATLREAISALPSRGAKVAWSPQPAFTLDLLGRAGARRGAPSSGYGSSAQSSSRSGAAAATWRRRETDRSDYGAQSSPRSGESSDRTRGKGRGGGRMANSRGGKSRRRRATDKEERAPNRTRRREDSPQRTVSQKPDRSTRRREDSPQRTASPDPCRRKEASPSPLRGRERRTRA